MLDCVDERPNEPRPSHALQLHTVVVQRLDHILDAADREAAIYVSLDVLDHDELERSPSLLNVPSVTQYPHSQRSRYVNDTIRYDRRV